MFATITNRGAQVCLSSDHGECQRAADEINSRNGDVFAWIQEVPEDTQREDIPGKGKWYM